MNRNTSLLSIVVALSVLTLGYFFLPALFSVDYGVTAAKKNVPSLASTASVHATTSSAEVLASTSKDMPAHTMTGGVAGTTVPVPADAVTHIPTPKEVHGMYMSECAAGTPSFRALFMQMLDTSALNTIVIDIKDFSGGIAFPTSDPMLAPFISTKCGAKDMREFIAKLHEKHVYVIGRITVFQDPLYAKAHPELAVKTKAGGVWKNFGGLAFIDVGAQPFWDYIVELAKVSYTEEGFDELNFDYIRFPSDGPMAMADYTFDRGKTKSDALEEFFKHLHDALVPIGVPISADLFGYVTVHTDDLGIGQELERALPYFDFIDPMVYPSHYNSGFLGIANVNSAPYKIVHVSLATAAARAAAATTSVYAFGETPVMKTVVAKAHGAVATTTKEAESGLYEKLVFPAEKIRPWLQSFDYPVPYTPAMVAAQIQATTDAGIHSWLMWDAGNKYTSLRKMLEHTTAAAAAAMH